MKSGEDSCRDNKRVWIGEDMGLRLSGAVIGTIRAGGGIPARGDDSLG